MTCLFVWRRSTPLPFAQIYAPRLSPVDAGKGRGEVVECFFGRLAQAKFKQFEKQDTTSKSPKTWQIFEKWCMGQLRL